MLSRRLTTIAVVIPTVVLVVAAARTWTPEATAGRRARWAEMDRPSAIATLSGVPVANPSVESVDRCRAQACPVAKTEDLESKPIAGLVEALRREGKGSRWQEYVEGLLLDRLVQNPSAMEELLASVVAPTDIDSMRCLVIVLEEYSKAARPEQRRPLEERFLFLLEHDSDQERRNAALHYLLASAQQAPLSDETLLALRDMAARDASGLVRAGSLWLVAAREETSARDARLFSSMESDADATVRQTAAEGLGRLATGPIPSAQALRAVDLLGRESSGEVKKTLLASLVERGVEDPASAVRGIAALAPAEADADVRGEMVRVLYEIGGPEAQPWLEAWRTDPALASQVQGYLEALAQTRVAHDDGK